MKEDTTRRFNVTVFPTVDRPKEPTIVDIDKVFDAIRTGGKHKDTILKITKLRTKEERNPLKKTLPAICFNGEFSYRNINNLEKHNGLMIVDVDDIEDSEMDSVRSSIENLPYTFACFLSPSYNGFKFIVRIPTIDVEKLGTVESDIVFKEYFSGLQNDLKNITIDASGKDTSRACFLSYDPNIYVNYDAVIFDEKAKIERPKNYVENVVIPKIEKSQQWALDKIYEMVDYALDGERHHKLYNASMLAGGYISGGVLEQHEAEETLASAFTKRPFDKDYQYRKTIDAGIKNGIHKPLYDMYEKNKPRLRDESPYEIHPQLINDSTNPVKKTPAELMYVRFNEFVDEAHEMYEIGNPRGQDGRFQVGREFHSYRNGYSTFVYSAPHSGKTQFCMSELTYLAERYGNKIAVYSKELGAPKDVLAEVASIYIGKLYNHQDDNLRMNKVQRDEAEMFFEKHFFVIDPQYKKQDLDVTVDAIFDCVEDIERIEGIKIDNVYIDPLSEVDDDGEDRIDRFVKYVNKRVNDDARINDRHNFLVSHVRDQQPIVDKNTGHSWFPVPTAREVAGGQNSFKQGHQMICVYRPSPHRIDQETQAEYLKNESHIYVQKSRPKGVGRIGMYKLYYDWKTNRYYEDTALTIYSKPSDQQTDMDIFDINPEDAF